MITILTVVGPTASGKTGYAIKQATACGGEIISVDSRQIYHGMAIGTCQPTVQELAEVPHHLVGILDPREKIDAGKYDQLVRDKIRELHKAGIQPILCGGTGLYVRALRLGLAPHGPSDPKLRQDIVNRIERDGAQAVLDELLALDPVAAEGIHPNNKQRLVRALEIVLSSEVAPAGRREWNDSDLERDSEAKAIIIDGVGEVKFDLVGLLWPRDQLYDRINARVDIMLEQGWLKEVQGLLESGLTLEHHAMQGVGYAELARVLDGELELDTALATIKQRSRNFAKRQLTWYRREPVRWLDPALAFD